MNIAWFGEVQTGGMCLFGSFFPKPCFSPFQEVLRQVFKLSCLNEFPSFKKTGP